MNFLQSVETISIPVDHFKRIKHCARFNKPVINLFSEHLLISNGGGGGVNILLFKLKRTSRDGLIHSVPLSKPKVGLGGFSLKMICLLHSDSHCSVISIWGRRGLQTLFKGACGLQNIVNYN